jgi:hypothetical protein
MLKEIYLCKILAGRHSCSIHGVTTTVFTSVHIMVLRRAEASETLHATRKSSCATCEAYCYSNMSNEYPCITQSILPDNARRRLRDAASSGLHECKLPNGGQRFDVPSSAQSITRLEPQTSSGQCYVYVRQCGMLPGSRHISLASSSRGTTPSSTHSTTSIHSSHSSASATAVSTRGRSSKHIII